VTTSKPAPVRLFYSYSHKDEDLRKELETHLALLQNTSVIDQWHDRKIGAGEEWAGQIDVHLEAADVILLLVSSDFLASRYCYDVEIKRALERHAAGEAVVIPIIIRPVHWEGAPFSRLQALPTDAKPVTGRDWHSQDEAWKDVTRGVLATVRQRVPAPPDSLSQGPNPPFLSLPLAAMIQPDDLDAQCLAIRQGGYPDWTVVREEQRIIDRGQRYTIELEHASGRLEKRGFRWDMTDPYGGVLAWCRIR
jgi:hypothetical protein